MTAKLKLIKTTHRAVVDIYAEHRAKIEATDWARVHIRGDRNPPLELSDKPTWKGWLK
jgi:hypothetical protein